MNHTKEITIDRSAEWQKSLEVMRGLFPKWIVTSEQLKSWKQKFGMLNPEWYREALHLTYNTYNSDNPKPKWVMECFRQVRAGHQGIPLNESETACIKTHELKAENEMHEAEVLSDRKRAKEIVATWTSKECYKWGKEFADRFKFLSERNNLKDSATWTTTFTQFVLCYRRKQEPD